MRVRTSEAAAVKRPVALVTGGSRGIGRAICLGFGRQGYEVVAIGRDMEELAQTERLVHAAGGAATSVTCDVRDADAIQRCVAGVLARFGAVDVLVNNAGGGSAGRPLTADELPDADW